MCSCGQELSVQSQPVEVKRIMRLMHNPPTDWVGIIVTYLDGTVSSWMEKEVQNVLWKHSSFSTT